MFDNDYKSTGQYQRDFDAMNETSTWIVVIVALIAAYFIYLVIHYVNINSIFKVSVIGSEFVSKIG